MIKRQYPSSGPINTSLQCTFHLDTSNVIIARSHFQKIRTQKYLRKGHDKSNKISENITLNKNILFLSSFKGEVSFKVSFCLIFHSLFVIHCLPSLPLLYSSFHSPLIIFQDTLPIFRVFSPHIDGVTELSLEYQSILEEFTILMEECFDFFGLLTSLKFCII